MVKKKKLSLISMSLLLAGSVLAACGNSESTSNEESGGNEGNKEPIVLKLAENQPDDYPTTIGDKEFAKLVEEKTDGRYKVEVYSGGQLGDEKSVIEQMQLGTMDLARTNAVPLAEFSKEIGVLQMPYIFKDEDHKWNVLNGEVGEEILGTLESANIVGLTYYDSGNRSFYNSKQPVESPEDMKGLKIRVQQSALFVDLVEALGASATPMAYDEVYSALQTGVIDGAENNYPSYYSSNHYEVAKYFTLDNHSGVPEVLMASKSLWDKLSDEDKEAFKEAAIESQTAQREAWDKLTEESKKAIEEAGNEVVVIEDTTPWREAVQSVYDKHGGDYSEWIEKIENE
ncbi:TRAP transporter substrate-binding protein [Metabacillus schmidteae]|uniref:TRAP transporter substrate-binding protein n=1 Tax=Metabacillus schmidteae TaxID=2730405 RepID=UPI00158BB391|nr:TRAP transporter substrate-binding protein [Metabacillus schmidteae]